MKKLIKRLLFMFVVIGLMYIGIEVFFDGDSARSMGMVAGFCTLIGYFIHWKFPNMKMLPKSLLIANVITIFEYFVGHYLVNQNFIIWDYRGMSLFGIPTHLNGQICIEFWLLWILLSPFMLFMIDKLKDEDVDVIKYYTKLFTNK